ncbi:hypothetical protein SAMN00777080_0621 [Aquiflexum balticum DSM 16537]|jgi:hypothetical protein|uniref:Uncharacterized protein n=1 Tax=Aquiflexum balticum DSM 16537 TaxID=758820 RepID=A0A1W2GZY2_9BACT|nr:hypothetical protein SAMN00777080_0621 [Aquiflexum balticum DSM 16537]
MFGNEKHLNVFLHLIIVFRISIITQITVKA